MTRITENTGFICLHCYNTVHAVTNGSYRNHCPFCLFSRHVDHNPGDRLNTCHGLMRPIGLVYHPKSGGKLSIAVLCVAAKRLIKSRLIPFRRTIIKGWLHYRVNKLL